MKGKMRDKKHRKNKVKEKNRWYKKPEHINYHNKRNETKHTRLKQAKHTS